MFSPQFIICSPRSVFLLGLGLYTKKYVNKNIKCCYTVLKYDLLQGPFKAQGMLPSGSYSLFSKSSFSDESPPPSNHQCPLDWDSQGSQLRAQPQIIAKSSQIQQGQKVVHCYKAMYWVLHYGVKCLFSFFLRAAPGLLCY